MAHSFPAQVPLQHSGNTNYIAKQLLSLTRMYANRTRYSGRKQQTQKCNTSTPHSTATNAVAMNSETKNDAEQSCSAAVHNSQYECEVLCFHDDPVTGNRYYLCNWIGYDEQTWEPRSSLGTRTAEELAAVPRFSVDKFSMIISDNKHPLYPDRWLRCEGSQQSARL
jgi:hypothetical protein